ncbi:MAG TPA: FTR1 family protein [Nevskiales bacterium]|nr:FTR1 family protein [Nevskiales bacterium]
MFGSALIVYREVLEAALVVSIVAAGTRGLPGRGLWLWAGVAAGVVGALLLAAFADVIAGLADGVGQELFNASVLMTAVVMLGWHNVWMARHGRELAQRMAQLGRDVSRGVRSFYALAIVVGLAVLREGSEVVLFMYGLAAGGDRPAALLGGGVLGLVLGAVTGLVMYQGLLRIPLRHFFGITGWLILLLAAGLASQAARFLIQADVLPSLGGPLWDSSKLVASDFWLGELLRVLVGYDARPSGTQLLFYMLTLTIIGVCMKWFSHPAAVVRAVVFVLGGAMLASLIPAQRAEAGPADKIYTPQVEYGETELELRGGYVYSHGRESGDVEHGEQAYVLDIGRGITPWWFTELVVEYEKPRGDSGEVEAIEWENVFQLTEPGQYFVDFGLFLEYAHALEDDAPDRVEFGPMLQKDFGSLTANLNLLAEHETGHNRNPETEYEYRTQLRQRTRGGLDYGLQGFGEFEKHSEQLWGPAIFGTTKLDETHKLKYDAALLAGLNHDSPDAVLRWQLEYEF